jgi:glycosyltransferase involved in cell wall biosynthesis
VAALSALAAEPGLNGSAGSRMSVRCGLRRDRGIPLTHGEVRKALIEAVACARAIVATDMPGCREVVRAGETGLLVPPHDIASLAEALATLAGDAARRQAMGRAGRALALREFGEEGVARQTLALYHRVMRERSTVR